MNKNISLFMFFLVFSAISFNADCCECECQWEGSSSACCQSTNSCYPFRKRAPFGSFRCNYYYPCCSVFIDSRVFALPDDEPLWVGERTDDFVKSLTR